MHGKILLLITALAVFSLPLAGCGGGGGTAAPAGTTVNRGVVTAEGNIAVNGYFYNISSATITIDGVAATKRDLRVGMVVTVRGIFDNHTSHAIRRMATSVDYATDFQGPVDCVNILNNTMTIMGQQVLVTTDSPSATVFANFTSTGPIFANFSTVTKLNPHLSPQLANPNLLADPNPASPTFNPYLFSMVKVSGLSNDINGFMATRIELLAQQVDPTATPFPIGIRGTASSVDLVGMAFNVGNLTIDMSQMHPAYIPRNFTAGDFVSVRGFVTNFTPGNAPSLVVANGSITPAVQGISANDGDHVTLEGYVLGLSGTSFTVGGTPVDASTVSLSGIANAVKVHVEGTFSGGVLSAQQLTPL